MNIKKIFEEFEEKVKKTYPDILMGIEKIGEYYRVYYHLKNFDIYDMSFHEIMGKAILETFYKKGVFNLGQTHFNLERAKKVFPELNKETEAINLRIDLTKKYRNEVKVMVAIEEKMKIELEKIRDKERIIKEFEIEKNTNEFNNEIKKFRNKLNITNAEKYLESLSWDNKKVSGLSSAA